MFGEAINKLRLCSRTRGKILHEHGLDIQDLKEYKNQIKESMKLSFEVLNFIKFINKALK